MTDVKKRWMKRAAIAGTLAGVLCHFVPEEYRAVCQAASRITAISCGV